MLTALPETPERAQQELDVQTTLSVALIATRGWGAPEVETVQARALCQQIGKTPRRFDVLWGQCGFYATWGKLQTARALAEQLFELAQRLHDPALLCPTTYMMGGICLFLGELTTAWTYLEQGMALYEPQRHQAYAVMHGVDLGVVCLCHAAFTLWLLGYPDQALHRSHATLALAQTLGYPYSLAFGLTWVTMLHQVRGEVAATQERTATLIALCTEQAIPYWLAGGRVLQGWALAQRGQGEVGITQMCQGLAAWQVTGDICLKQALPDVAQAEACFRQVLTIARCQQAKSLELRAAMSLSHLWQQQDKCTEARELLAPIYGWFTEGFATADLQEAKALLEELAG